MIWVYTVFALLLVIGYHSDGPIRSVFIWILAIGIGLYNGSYAAGLGAFIGLTFLLFPQLLLFFGVGVFLGKWLSGRGLSQ